MDPNFRYIDAIKEFILDNYKMDITEAELMEGAVKKLIEENPELVNKAVEGMFESLDKHSVYFDEKDYNQFSEDVDGQFGGIGISIDKKDEYITVIAPLENTPAQRVGLKSGDKIISVNGEDITNKEIDLISVNAGEPGNFRKAWH